MLAFGKLDRVERRRPDYRSIDEDIGFFRVAVDRQKALVWLWIGFEHRNNGGGRGHRNDAAIRRVARRDFYRMLAWREFEQEGRKALMDAIQRNIGANSA